MLSAWQRRSPSLLGRALAFSFDLCQKRCLGYANVWIDEATAARRPRPQRILRRRKEFGGSRGEERLHSSGDRFSQRRDGFSERKDGFSERRDRFSERRDRFSERRDRFDSSRSWNEEPGDFSGRKSDGYRPHLNEAGDRGFERERSQFSSRDRFDSSRSWNGEAGDRVSSRDRFRNSSNEESSFPGRRVPVRLLARPNLRSRDRLASPGTWPAADVRVRKVRSVEAERIARRRIRAVGKASDIDAAVDGLVKESTSNFMPRPLNYKKCKEPEIIGYWRDGVPRLAGREGRLRILDSGKILGTNRRVFIKKYGKPQRIKKKDRLAKIARLEERKAHFDSEGNPIDTGYDRRKREKMIEKMIAKAKLKRRDKNLLPTTSEDSSSPFMVRPDPTRKVMTMFGEIDVTRVRMLRDYKASLKRMESSKQALQLSEGVKEDEYAASSNAKLLTTGAKNVEAARLKSSKNAKLLTTGAQNVEAKSLVVSSDSAGPMKLNREVKLLPAQLKKTKQVDIEAASKEADKKMNNAGKMKLKASKEEVIEKTTSSHKQSRELKTLETSRKHSLVKDEVSVEASKRAVGTVTKSKEHSIVAAKIKRAVSAVEAEKLSVKESKRAEKGKTEAQSLFLDVSATKLQNEEDLVTNEIAEIGTLLKDDEGDEEENAKWVLPAEGKSGYQIARMLGTDKLMDFPRLVKVKKPRSKPKYLQAFNEEYTLFSAFQQAPSPFTALELEPEKAPVIREEAVSLLEEIKKRNLEVRQTLQERVIKDYEDMLRMDLASPVKKQRVSKRLIRDPDDPTNKRPDEKTKLGPAKEPGTNAKFRMIQPPLHILEYLDSQMLGRRRLDEWRKAGYNLKFYAPLDNVPFTKGEERHKIQQSVFRNKHLFVAAAQKLSSIPPAELPEIAFAGRSNAGKSKLINALTRHWGRARTSPRPGTTKTVNFYVLGKELCMVDLPGYSFMYGKPDKIEARKQLTKDYITIREELKRVCVLVDSQWGFKHTDREFIEFLESVNQKYQLILTKTDKVSPLDLARRVTQAEELLKDAKCHVRPLLMVSSRHGAGIGKLRKSLTSVLDA